jgi:predicted acylesterase/phospholipase RssA
MDALWQPRVVSFSSGGARVIGHLGVLAALLEGGMCGGVREWWGCSGGALCALLGALGVTSGWLRDCATALDLRILGAVEEEMVADFFRTWCVNSGTAWKSYVGRVLETWEPGAAAWRFADLAAARPGVRLCITAANLTRGVGAVFSAETTPDMLILDAVHASCAVPLFYAPWISGSGELFCDGAVLEQFPWSAVKDKEGTLVVLCSETSLGGNRAVRSGEIRNLTEYLARIYHMGRVRVEGSPRNWIAVNNRTVGVLDFDLSASGRTGLFEEGWRAGRGWMAFRQSQTQSPSEQSPCSPLESGDLHSDASFPCAGNRRSDSHPPHSPLGSDPSPSHRPNTGRQPGVRRWSL